MFTDIHVICLSSSQTLWHNWPAKQSNSVEYGKIRVITPLKVIQGNRGRYQSKNVVYTRQFLHPAVRYE